MLEIQTSTDGVRATQIKANELRLGNRLLYRGEKMSTVDNLGHFFRTVDLNGIPNGSDDISDYQPIPLTTELLKSLGWIWNEECNSFEKYPNGDARMNLQHRPVNDSYTMFNYVLKAKIADNIYYLHQFQNLYFALTGQELNVKL